MSPEEKEEFHKVADDLWEMAKKAKTDGFYELESILMAVCDVLHARGSELRKKYDSII